MDSSKETQERKDLSSHASADMPTSGVNASSASIDASSFPTQKAVSSPIPEAFVVIEQTPASSISPTEVSPVAMDVVDIQTSLESHTPVVAVLDKDAISVASETTVTKLVYA